MKPSVIEQLSTGVASATQNADGIEFLFARDLQALLDYAEWRNFFQVIDKAKNDF